MTIPLTLFKCIHFFCNKKSYFRKNKKFSTVSLKRSLKLTCPQFKGISYMFFVYRTVPYKAKNVENNQHKIRSFIIIIISTSPMTGECWVYSKNFCQLLLFKSYQHFKEYIFFNHLTVSVKAVLWKYSRCS